MRLPSYVQKYGTCERCAGSGQVNRATGRAPRSVTDDATPREPCPGCNGHGQTHRAVAVSIDYGPEPDEQLELL